MYRVIVAPSIVGAAMEVCACADATDDEILAVCNHESPAGTTNGWSSVVREAVPVRCQTHRDRWHVLVVC